MSNHQGSPSSKTSGPASSSVLGLKRTSSARSVSTAHHLPPTGSSVGPSSRVPPSAAAATPPTKKQRNPTNYVWTIPENRQLMTWTAAHLPQVWVKASVQHALKIKMAVYKDNPQITAENIRHKVNNIKAKYRKVRARWLEGKDDSFITTDVRSKY